jgi:hypothetical protein
MVPDTADNVACLGPSATNDSTSGKHRAAGVTLSEIEQVVGAKGSRQFMVMKLNMRCSTGSISKCRAG